MLALQVSALFLGFLFAVTADQRNAAWPNGPLTTKGTTIVDASGSPVTYVGVNWPGAAEVMIPEGLQYSSIANIVSKIKSLGMNVVRLTYAIEMIDDIYDGGDVSLETSLQRALGITNGSLVLQEILKQNPSFSPSTTRLEVFDAVAAELAAQQIYLHLDNHVSKAQWCCNLTDGNGWFGDTYFDVSNWKRGLSYMAAHGKQWPAMTSMSMRNELRSALDDLPVELTYGWPLWYTEVTSASQEINQANDFPLIFFSGINSDTTLQPVTAGYDLGNGQKFNLNDFPYKNKIVFELHNYNIFNDDYSCPLMEAGLYLDGYDAMDTSSFSAASNHAPVVLSEFGFAQDGSTYKSVYAQCIKNYTTQNKYGWMQWTLSGSYYIREGTQDSDDSYGLLDHTWSTWRSTTDIDNYVLPMVQGTLG